MHIENLRELSFKILSAKHADSELVKYLTCQVQHLTTSVLRDCCIEIARFEEDIELSGPLQYYARFLEIRQKVSKDDAQKYQLMCSSPSKSSTESFLVTVPFLIQTVKDIFIGESTGISNVQSGLWGLPESIINQIASSVLGAEQTRSISKFAGEMLEILKKLCLNNTGGRSTKEIERWSCGGGMLYMLDVLYHFFKSREERKLYKRLDHFSSFMTKIMLNPDAFDEFFIRDVRNLSKSLAKFAKFDPTKLVHFELVDSVTNSPIPNIDFAVKYDEYQNTFSQLFQIRKHSEDELQLDARAIVHLDGKVRQVGAFRSVILLPAASEKTFDSCSFADLSVAVKKESESGKLQVVLSATKRADISQAINLLKSKLGQDKIDGQETEITACPLTVLTTTEKGTALSLRLVYKWGSEVIALESKDFVALVDSLSVEGACAPLNIRTEGAYRSILQTTMSQYKFIRITSSI